MPQGLEDIETLIEMIAKLPGLGPRSARRAVLQLIKKRDQQMQPLARMITRVAETAQTCLNCGNISTQEICQICADTRRGAGQICVVEEVADLWAMERSGVFKGRYHVLGGTLSPLDNVGPDDLGLTKLSNRITSEEVTEVILALNATVDGQTTAHYIAETLANRGLSISLLAQGVPIGGELDYLDDGTISAALSARKPI